MMSNEEFDRKAEFIINQQAQFAADIQRLQEAQAITEQKVVRAAESAAYATEAVGRAVEAVARTAETVANLAAVTHEGFRQTFEGFRKVDAKIEALADSHKLTDEKLQALADSQKLTDEKLRTLVTNVDRHVNEGHNTT